MAGLDQRIEARHGEVRASHEDDAHGARLWRGLRRAKRGLWSARMASQEIEALSPGAGAASRARAALGAARGAAPDEAARERARAAARRAAERRREALDLLDLRQCRHRPTRARSAATRAATTRCCAWSRRSPTCGRSTARGCSPAAIMCSAGGCRRWRACGPRISAIDKLVARVSAGGIDEVVLAMNATLEGQTTAHYLAERLEKFPDPPHPVGPRSSGRRRARLSRRGHAGPGACGARRPDCLNPLR